MIESEQISVFVPVSEKEEGVVGAGVLDHLFVNVCILVTNLVSVCLPGCVSVFEPVQELETLCELGYEYAYVIVPVKEYLIQTVYSHESAKEPEDESTQVLGKLFWGSPEP